jgi:hypothetical protein
LAVALRNHPEWILFLVHLTADPRRNTQTDTDGILMLTNSAAGNNFLPDNIVRQKTAIALRCLILPKGRAAGTLESFKHKLFITPKTHAKRREQSLRFVC